MCLQHQHLPGDWGFFLLFFPALSFTSAWNGSHANYTHIPFQALGIRNTLPLCLSQPSDLYSRTGEGMGWDGTGREEEEEAIHPTLPPRSRSLKRSLQWKKVRFKRRRKKKKEDKRCSLLLLGSLLLGVTTHRHQPPWPETRMTALKSWYHCEWSCSPWQTPGLLWEGSLTSSPLNSVFLKLSPQLSKFSLQKVNLELSISVRTKVIQLRQKLSCFQLFFWRLVWRTWATKTCIFVPWKEEGWLNWNI